MNITIFISLLFTLQFLYWFVGRRASRNLNNRDDYFLAGKSVKLFPLMMTFLATQVGGGVVLGAAEEAYQFGWPVLLYPLGGALGLILLGSGIGKRLAEFRVSTVAEIFEVVYQSPLLRKIASILSIVSLFMILVAQIIASSKFLASLGFNNKPAFIAFWAIVIIYTAQGGLKAVISTDMAQAAFFSIVFFLCFGLVLYNNPNFVSMQISQHQNLAEVSTKLTGWLLMPLLFIFIEQDMGQRCFAGGSPRIVSLASLLSGIAMIFVCIVPVFFGCLAKEMGLEVMQGSSVLMAVVEKTTNPGITALIGCAILAAIISTATSLINAIGSNLASDFNLSIFQQINRIQFWKVMTCIISIMSIFFAFFFDNVVDVLIQSYELAVSSLFVPLFFGIFKKKNHFLSALLAILFGMLGFFLFRFYPIPFPKEIGSILLSIMGYTVGNIISYNRGLILEKIR